MPKKEMYSDAIVLGNLNSHSDIFIARKKDCVGNCPNASKLDKVGHDQGIDAFLLTTAINRA